MRGHRKSQKRSELPRKPIRDFHRPQNAKNRLMFSLEKFF